MSKETDAQREYLQNLNSSKDLQAQLKDLDKTASQAQQDLEASNNRKKRFSKSSAILPNWNCN